MIEEATRANRGRQMEAVTDRNAFIASSPRWLMTFTALRPDVGLSKGWEVSRLSAASSLYAPSPTIIRCTCRGVWLYFRVGLRYRDVEALSAERDASTSLSMRTLKQ
jgi:hypothetical protein